MLLSARVDYDTIFVADTESKLILSKGDLLYTSFVTFSSNLPQKWNRYGQQVW